MRSGKDSHWISVTSTALIAAFGSALGDTARTMRHQSLEMLLFNLRMDQKKNANFDAMFNVFSGCAINAAIAIAAVAAAWAAYFLFIKRTRAAKAYRIAVILVSCACLACGLSLSPITSAIPVHFRDLFVSTSLYENRYADPAEQNVRFPNGRRNLIHIFVESLETTLADKASIGELDENLIPNTTRIANDNLLFRGWQSAVGTDWTVAGHISQTCGLPILLEIKGSPPGGDDSLFPNVATIGDVLKDEGYEQVYMCGSDAQFGYRASYFSRHGYEIWDLNSARAQGKIPKDYYEFWGFEDEKLYQYAREKLTSLSDGDSPFNLTMLTEDTHFYDGYVCRLCHETYPSRYKNVVACADCQLSDFIRWLQNQDFYADTTVVISGDHLYMDSAFYSDMGVDHNDREVFFCVINPANGVSATSFNREYTSFDIFPTVLSSIGAEWDCHRLGLGVDLFSSEKTLAEEFGINSLNDELSRGSDFYDGLIHPSAK